MIKAQSFGGAKYWLLIVDNATGFKFSYFLKKKSEVPKIIVRLIKHLKQTKGYVVKYLHCNNAGENLATEKECLAAGLGVTFEYTASNTPQQNGRMERHFATLYGRVQSMLNAAKLNQEFWKGLWAECAQMATNFDNLDCELKGETRFKAFYRYNDKAFKYIWKFGEVAIVTSGEKIQNKLKNCGILCLYLGQATVHSEKIAQFMKISIKQVI